MLIASGPTLAQARVLGTTGSIAVAAGGSLGGPGGPVAPAVVCVYVGLTLLVVGRWRLAPLAAGPLRPAALQVTLLQWTVPLVLCQPMFSRDVYSYLAQGAMVGAGIDIYHHGPAALDGPLAAEVPAIWQDTPAPYGPVFVGYATAIANLAGPNLPLGVLGMRAAALLGVATLAVCLPWLARRCGQSPTGALWLGVLNPLVLVHLVAGAHNDAVMLGLLVAGVGAAAAGRWALGVVLVTLGALVKVPAAVGLFFLARIWADGLTGRWREARATVGVGVFAGGCALLVTAVVGSGFGWIHALGTPVSAQNWSPTSMLGRLTVSLLDLVGVGVSGDVLAWWRWAGLGVAVLSCVAIWRRRDRLGAVYALGLALGALVILGPALRPWYVLWGVVFVAAAAPDARVRRWSATGCGVLAMVVLPNGFAPDPADVGQAVLGIGLAVAALLLGRGWTVRLDADPSDPSAAAAEVSEVSEVAGPAGVRP